MVRRPRHRLSASLGSLVLARIAALSPTGHRATLGLAIYGPRRTRRQQPERLARRGVTTLAGPNTQPANPGAGTQAASAGGDAPQASNAAGLGAGAQPHAYIPRAGQHVQSGTLARGFGLGGIVRHGFLTEATPSEADAPPTAPEAAPAPLDSATAALSKRVINVERAAAKTSSARQERAGRGREDAGHIRSVRLQTRVRTSTIRKTIWPSTTGSWPGLCATLAKRRSASGDRLFFPVPAMLLPPARRAPWIRNVSDVNESVSKYVDSVGAGGGGKRLRRRVGVCERGPAASSSSSSSLALSPMLILRHKLTRWAIEGRRSGYQTKQMLQADFSRALIGGGLRQAMDGRGRSSHPGVAIGEGGVAGMQYLQKQQAVDNEWRLNAAKINELGSESR